MSQQKMPCSSRPGTRDQQVAMHAQSRRVRFPEREGRHESGSGRGQVFGVVQRVPIYTGDPLPVADGGTSAFQPLPRGDRGGSAGSLRAGGRRRRVRNGGCAAACRGRGWERRAMSWASRSRPRWRRWRASTSPRKAGITSRCAVTGRGCRDRGRRRCRSGAQQPS